MTDTTRGGQHWYTPKEAAKHARLCVDTIYNHIHDGRLRCERAGGSRRLIRIRHDWLEAWLADDTPDAETIKAAVDEVVGR